jgi:hypothetical protein
VRARAKPGSGAASDAEIERRPETARDADDEDDDGEWEGAAQVGSAERDAIATTMARR